MGFRINRGIFQFKDPASDTFINKFKIDERGEMVEVDQDGNVITTYMRLGDKSTDADLLDGVDSSAFIRSNASDTFTGTITMNTQQAFKPANFGQGVYGRYDSYRYQHVWGMGQSWHMAENGTNLGNFYGLAYTHTNIGGESKSGLSHQTLFVENGLTKTAIGRGVWTDGTITATGNANISGNLDIGGAVVGTSSGVTLAVGGTSTYGVLTSDNARNQLVVSANYYPHFVIAADLNNNPNHGAVISMVGTEGSTPRQWNIGISNQNPFLFSIGYNRSGDNNPHYGVGDNWSNDDTNHARFSIDRDGNTKIRGSLYVNGTKGGITTGSKVATESYAATLVTGIDTRINDEVLPQLADHDSRITTNRNEISNKLNSDGKAVNSSKSDLIQTISSTREGDDAMPSIGYSLQHFLAKGPSNNDGHTLGMTWTGTTVYGAQIWVDTDPNNKMAFRSRSNAGVWTGWNNLWHDGNLSNVSQLSNDSGYINGEGLARFNRGTIDASSSVFTHMRGATSLNNPSGIGGAIKILLPAAASFTNTMMFMTVKVYEYSTSKSFILHCGGYNYGNKSWYNTFAYIVGAETRANIPVKFGHDGTRNIVWIGNPDWSWSYPNVFVTDFASGHTQNSNWGDGWDIVFDQEPAINVTGSHIAYRNITEGNIGGQSVNYAASAGNADTVDGIDSSSFLRSDIADTAYGNITLKYNTDNTDGYEAIMFAPYNDAAGLNDYIIKASSSRGVFGRKSFGWHVHSNSAFGIYSNGWEKLFGVEGDTGNSFAKGTFTANNLVTNQINIQSITSDGTIANDNGSYLHLGGWGVSRTHSSAVLVNTAYRADYATNLFNENISRFTNDSGYATTDAVAGVDARITDEVLPQVTTNADNIARNATDIATKLGTTGKAADSNLLDGLDSSAYMRDNGWNNNPGQDADTQVGMSSDFSYSNNAPHTGDLIRFGSSNYSLQLSSQYNSSDGRLSFRTKNGDNGSWNTWREIWHTGNFNPSSYLTTTAKAADSNLLDGYDHTAFWKDDEDRRAKIIRFTGEGGNSGNSVVNYGIYQAGGAWSHPYPDLIIAYHTGIKIGGYKNYGGVKIYNDAPERSGAAQVASFGDGDANVRVANNLHIGSAGGWITDLLNAKATTGDVAGVDARINDEILPQITTNADGIATNRTEISNKLNSNGKAADSEAVDGVDSSRIVYGANARRSNRYDQSGIVDSNQNSGFYYGYNPDGAPFAEWWNWVAIAGASWTSSNNYDFKLAHNFHGDDFYVSRMTNGSQSSWRRIIDSGNIGSQTVANAGYATNAGNTDAIDGIGFRNTGSNSAVNADSLNSNGITYYNGGVPNFSGNATDGALYSQIYSSSWQHQIAGDYRSGQLAVRGKNNGTWKPWRTILDSSNFTSFVPAATEPVQAVVEGGNDSTLVSILFSTGEGVATFTLADGQTFRLAMAR